jgi:hypothetical protein
MTDGVKGYLETEALAKMFFVVMDFGLDAK